MTETGAASPVGAPGLRVMQLMAGAPQGGAELYFVRLCLALQRAGLTQVAIVRPNPERNAKLSAGGIAIIEAPYGGWLDFTTRRTIKRAIASFKPAVVMSYMTRATQYVPRGDFVHVARLGGYYDLRHYRHCDHLVGNTPDLVEYFMRGGWLRERVHFIPNFVDTHRSPPVDRAHYATPAAAPLIFALGRLHTNKAFDVLLAAVAQIPGAYLWLAGEGPERAALESLAADFGIASRVKFLGWQDDAAPFFAAADVVAVPSRHEPLGNVVLEAWAQGVAVVAAASHGPRFLIADGESGLLAPVEDAGALAASLSRVLADRELARRLAAGGAKALSAQFSEEAVVARYLALFRQVVA
jgi:glycosyltransferase involved in cell wall biosynthesis